MRNINQLPALEVLLAASFKFHMRVLVYFWGDKPVIFTAHPKKIPSGSVPDVHLLCQAGTHFNLLVEISALRETIVSPCFFVCSIQEEATPVACGEVVDESCNEEVTQLYICPTYKPECYRISREPMISVKIGSIECCAILDTGAEF